MAVHARRDNGIRSRFRALMAVGTWLLILTTGITVNALAGPAAKGAEKRSIEMNTDTTARTATATFAMG